MSNETKSCRFCGEEIKAAASLCRFCNREQPETSADKVFYAGPGNPPVGQYFLDGVVGLVVVGLAVLMYSRPSDSPVRQYLLVGLLGLFVVGLGMLVAHIVRHKARRYTITSKRISVETGIFSKKIDVLELFRVQDLRFESNIIFGKIIVTSTDKTSPQLVLPIPAAKQVFEQLQGAIDAARKGSHVRLEERA